MAELLPDKNELSELSSLSSRLMNDMKEMGTISESISSQFNVQKNLADALVALKNKEVGVAKTHILLAKVQRDLTKAILDDSLEKVNWKKLEEASLVHRNTLSNQEFKEYQKQLAVLREQFYSLIDINLIGEHRYKELVRENELLNETKDTTEDISQIKLFQDSGPRELLAMTNRLVSDLNSMEGLSGHITEQFNTQKNISLAREAISKGDLDTAKAQILLAKVHKDLTEAILDGSFNQLAWNDIEEQSLEYQNQLTEEQFDLYQRQLATTKLQFDELQKVNLLGESIADQIKRQNDALKDQTNSFREIEKVTLGIYDTLLETVKSPLTSVVYLATQAWMKATSLAGAFKTMRSEIGIGVKETWRLAKETGNVTDQLVTSREDAMKMQAVFTEEMQGSLDVNKDLFKTAEQLNVALGMSVETAAKIANDFKKITLGSAEAGKEAAFFAVHLAKAAGVAPGKILASIADNAGEAAKFTDKTGKNIVKAAVASSKLGIEFGKVLSVAEKLMDFDSMIEGSLNASVLLGQELNMTRAAELAFTGDLAGMMKEVAGQVESIGGLENLNMIQRQALADATGLEITDLAKIMQNKDKLNSLDGEALRIANEKLAAGEELADVFDTGLKVQERWFNAEQVLSYAAGIRTAAAATTIFKNINVGKAFGWMKSWVGGIGKIGGTAGKLAEHAEKMKSTTEKFSSVEKKIKPGPPRNPIVNWLNTWKRLDLVALGKFTLAVGVMILSLPLLALALKQFTDVPWDAALIGMGALTGLALVMKLIGNQTGSIIKGALAMVIMGAALIPLAYGLSLLTDVKWETLAIAGAAILGLTVMMFGLGALIAGPGAIIFGAGVLGFVLLSGALLLFGVAMQSVSKGIGSFQENLSSMSTVIPQLSPLVPLLGSLAVMVPGMIAIGAGFAAMGIGLVPLVLGLTAIAPLVPLLERLSKVTGIGGGGKEEISATSENEKDDVIIEKLQELIDVVKTGTVLKVDQREFGILMGMHASKVAAIENRN